MVVILRRKRRGEFGIVREERENSEKVSTLFPARKKEEGAVALGARCGAGSWAEEMRRATLAMLSGTIQGAILEEMSRRDAGW